MLLFGDLINNSPATQQLVSINGVFFDQAGQMVAGPDNTEAYWSVDVIPPGGSVPFELVVEGIEDAASFDLGVEAVSGGNPPRHDFELTTLNQWQVETAYCLAGRLRNQGAAMRDFLVIGATLYDREDRIVNFGDHFEPDFAAVKDDTTVDFEICVDPPGRTATRHELWAWGR
jgi:hypothetical protein